MDLSLKNKTAIVTGGTQGIGFSISEKLLSYGCNVALCSRNLKNISNAEKKLKKKFKNFYIEKVDVVIDEDINFFYKNILKKFSKVDILINNVGGGGNIGKNSFDSTSYKLWNSTIEANLGSAIKFTKLCLPNMKKNKWGRVISISSISTNKYTGRPWYNVAKNSQNALINSLSAKKTYVKNGITFNTISPGSIMTKNSNLFKLKKNNRKKFNEILKNNFPMEEIGDPEDISNLVLYLCSQYSRYINGANIFVDGGESKLNFKF